MLRGTATPLPYPPPVVQICLEKPEPVTIASKDSKAVTNWKWIRHDLVLCIPCAREVLNDLDPKKISLW